MHLRALVPPGSLDRQPYPDDRRTARMTDMTEDDASTAAEPSQVPPPRRPEREVRIRELRNAGNVIFELASAGAVGRVTSGGRLVGWLIPATPSEQRAEELHAQGRLRPGRLGGLAGHRPLPRRRDTAPLSHTLDQQRRADDR